MTRGSDDHAVRLTLAAGLAVVLTATALLPIFDGRGWWWRAIGAVVAVAGTGLVARRLALPAGAQPLLALAVLAEYLALVFAPGTLVLGLLPGSDSWAALRALLAAGATDIELLRTPVPTHPGLVLIASAGLGFVALLVDAVAVVLRRAALSGIALLVLFAVPGAVRAQGVGWLPFVLTAGGWLGLLLVESQHRNRRWGSALRPGAGSRSEVGRTLGADPGYARVGRRIGSAALGIAVIVPVLLPGLNARLLPGGAGDGIGGGPQTTTTYNPITRLRADLRLPEPRPILSYRTDDPRPDYLRLTTLDRFTDSGWTASRLSGSTKRDGVTTPLPDPVGLTPAATTQSVTSSIAITGLSAQWLPVPFPPRSVQVRGPWLYDDQSETVFGIRTNTGDLEQPYLVTASRVLPDRDLLAATEASAPLPDQVRPYAVRPTLTAFVVAATNQAVAGRTAPYDQVVALQAYFRNPANGFVYDTTPTVAGINGPSALEDFLRGKRGFCEQYASAMAAMVRQLGIPARVAVGFTRGTRQADNTYDVTTDDAHAWPEAWFAGAGWVRFEPTPRRDGQAVVPSYSVPESAGPQVPEPTAAPSAAPSAEPSSGPAAGQPDGRQPDGGLAQGDSGSTGVGWAVLIALTLLIVLALLSVPRLVHLARRRHRWRGAPTARTAWAQLVDDARDVGFAWSAAESVRTTGQRLTAEFALTSAAADAVQRLAQATERARYARPDGATTKARGLTHDSAVVRAALLHGAGRAARWRAQLVPASTVGWAVHRSGSAVADALDRLDEGWTSLRRRARLRSARN